MTSLALIVRHAYYPGMDKIIYAKTVIDRLDGPASLARHCGITTASVCGWKEIGIPKPWDKYLRLRFKKDLNDLPPNPRYEHRTTSDQ